MNTKLRDKQGYLLLSQAQRDSCEGCGFFVKEENKCDMDFDILCGFKERKCKQYTTKTREEITQERRDICPGCYFYREEENKCAIYSDIFFGFSKDKKCLNYTTTHTYVTTYTCTEEISMKITINDENMSINGHNISDLQDVKNLLYSYGNLYRWYKSSDSLTFFIYDACGIRLEESNDYECMNLFLRKNNNELLPAQKFTGELLLFNTDVSKLNKKELVRTHLFKDVSVQPGENGFISKAIVYTLSAKVFGNICITVNLFDNSNIGSINIIFKMK